MAQLFQNVKFKKGYKLETNYGNILPPLNLFLQNIDQTECIYVAYIKN